MKLINITELFYNNIRVRIKAPYRVIELKRFAADLVKEYEVIAEDNGKVVLKSFYPCDYEESRKLVLYTFKGENKGTLLFIHGLGRYNLDYLKYFPKSFQKHGYSSALMILPYHFDRTPSGFKSGELFLNTTDNTLLRSRFEHAVVDALTSLYYLKDQFGEPIYLMGYSFGGMIATIAASFYEDLKALSLVVTGGNFYHITWSSVVTKVFRVQYEKNKECNPEICKKLHGKDFYNYMERLSSPALPLNSAPIACYEYDPLVFAKFVKAPVIFFTALFDFFIPFKSSNELYKHLGSRIKNRYILPAGHITSFLIWRKFILKKSLKFFERVSE